MGNLDAIATFSANQMMVDMFGGFVNQLPTAHVGGHHQALVSEKTEGAVNGRFSEAGELNTGAVKNIRWGKMSTCFEEDIQDGIPLWGETKAAGAKLVGVLIFHKDNNSLL